MGQTISLNQIKINILIKLFLINAKKILYLLTPKGPDSSIEVMWWSFKIKLF